MDLFKYFRPSKPTLPVLSAYTVPSSTITAANKEIRQVPRAPYRQDSLTRQFLVRRFPSCPHTWNNHALIWPLPQWLPYQSAKFAKVIFLRISFGRFVKVFFVKFVLLDDSRKFSPAKVARYTVYGISPVTAIGVSCA